MLLKLKRTQTTKLGRLQMGVVYLFDPNKPDHKEVAGTLINRKFAVKVTKDQVEAEATDRDMLARAVAAGEADPGRVPLAVLERAAIMAQEAEEAATLAAVNSDKAAADKAAADKASADKAAADKAAADKAAADKAAADKAAADKAAADKAAADKAAADKAAADKVAADKAAADKEAADKAAADKAKKTAGGADK